jgi:hypothetical protein
MRNFFKGSEVPPAPETVVPSEIVDLGTIEEQIAAAELAGVDAFAEAKKKEEDRINVEARRKELIVEIENMIIGNRDLNSIVDSRGGKWLQGQEQNRRIRSAERNIGGSEVLDQERQRLDDLSVRLHNLEVLGDFQSPIDLKAIRSTLDLARKELETKESIFHGKVRESMQPFKDHHKQQRAINDDRVKFAIETVRATNPELFDRLFPDIAKIRGELTLPSQF